ncbi:MAG: histidine--tRNA ligase [Patescibacteria group bacterium]|jgi:histidyl-tRNA synthetase
MVTPQTLKGFRDFFPEDVFKRNYLKKKITQAFDLYGFAPIETPALEYLETFTGNIGEDEKLFFKFQDQGGRNVALRYDQTVPTCRFVAQHINELQFPYKRYQIQNVWRAEKPQKGRYREFLQCDADIFGLDNPEADAEVIALTLFIYEHLGFKDYVVKIGDRALFKDVPYSVIVAIDKLGKIGKDGVISEIVTKGFSKEDAAAILEKVLNVQPNEALTRIFSYLENAGFSRDHFAFDSSIARSFNYSTGPIWEVVIPGFTSGSVLGGERYDKLVGRFSDKDVPGTGFAIGFDRTLEAMEQFGLFPKNTTHTQVLVAVMSPELMGESFKLVHDLRRGGVCADVYLDGTAKIGKQIKYADKKHIPFVIFLGDEELAAHTVTVKKLETGEQQAIPHDQIISFFGDTKK